MSEFYGQQNFGDWADAQDVVYELTVKVNGIEAIKLSDSDLHELMVSQPEIDNAVEELLQDQFSDAKEAAEMMGEE